MSLDEAFAREAVRTTLEKLMNALKDTHNTMAGHRVARYKAHGTVNLLDGKPVAVGSQHPSLIALGPVPGVC